MNRNDKNTIFWVWNVANYALSSGKFLNYGKSAGVKVLTNIMSEFQLPAPLRGALGEIESVNFLSLTKVKNHQITGWQNDLKGVSYDKCTDVDHSQMWCATDIITPMYPIPSHQHIILGWGNCPSSCQGNKKVWECECALPCELQCSANR